MITGFHPNNGPQTSVEIKLGGEGGYQCAASLDHVDDVITSDSQMILDARFMGRTMIFSSSPACASYLTKCLEQWEEQRRAGVWSL